MLNKIFSLRVINTLKIYTRKFKKDIDVIDEKILEELLIRNISKI